MPHLYLFNFNNYNNNNILILFCILILSEDSKCILIQKVKVGLDAPFTGPSFTQITLKAQFKLVSIGTKHCRWSCLPTGSSEVTEKLQGIVGGLAYQDTVHARCHDCSLGCWSGASVCCQKTAGSSPLPPHPQPALHQ